MTGQVDVAVRCHGCATVVDPLDPAAAPLGRCPNADRASDVDHVLGFDPVDAGVTAWPDDMTVNPFVRYRTLQHWYWLGRARGLGDAALVEAVARIDRSVAGVTGGTGFVISPFDRDDRASEALGLDVWAKDDTATPAGSHKARHLMGLLLQAQVERLSARALAIASCGNAALAAATLARATRRPLAVFVPPDASPAVIDRLRSLGAEITTCKRQAGDPPGDPCMRRFREARARGAVAFCCQGPENGLTIDGGATLGYELAAQLSLVDRWSARLFVQVGGGALGSSTALGLSVAHRLGQIPSLPPLHCVQTEGAAPLHRAWRKVADRALAALGETASGDATDAERLSRPDAGDTVRGALGYAVTHRSAHMWPWEEQPASMAGGILDDETYDWYALVRAMLATGGWPVVVSEAHLARANTSAGANADATGTAGLAGAVALADAGTIAPGASVVALYTGVRRTA